MTAVASPFGFAPVYHPIGLSRAILRAIASGYGTAIYKGMPVILNTNGTVVAGTAAADLLGIFVGCEFIDATGKPNFSPFWPAGQVTQGAANARCWVAEDEKIVYKVQSVGSVPATAIGDQADVANVGAGSASTGLSTCALAAPVGAGSQGQFRIVDFERSEDNTPGDPFTIVHVQLARSQFIANKTAI